MQGITDMKVYATKAAVTPLVRSTGEEEPSTHFVFVVTGREAQRGRERGVSVVMV